MTDVNKYFENQLELAKEKSEKTKKYHLKYVVSKKSKSVAEQISKKQIKKLAQTFSNNKSKPDKRVKSKKQSTSADKDPDEFYESEDEGEADISSLFLPSGHTKQDLKKIVDDGDTYCYNERIKQWRNNLRAVSLENYEGKITSADIQYIFDGKTDPQEKHKVRNGLRVPNYIWKQLYKFQRAGVQWLWDLHQAQCGGLLGDEMGLGKTIQIIAFLAGLSQTDSESRGGLGPSLIVAPATVIYQWVSHFHYWCPELRVAVLHHTGSHVGNHKYLIKNLHNARGIVLITYAGIVKYIKDLMSRKWHYIILDEGHKIRNPDTQISKLIKKFQTPHKLLITGSPMQNNLQELWSLFDFIRPKLLGTYTVFMRYFALPLTQGGYANATELQEATALEIAKTLKEVITPYMLRRTKAEVQEHIKLPEKSEQVLFCALTQEQRDLYMGYLMSVSVSSILDRDTGNSSRARLLVALSTLKKICNHPDVYLNDAQEDCTDASDKKFGHWRKSGKMTVLNSLLKIWRRQGHKALIFSQSRTMLSVLEQYLKNQNYKYLKIDGTVNVNLRQNIIKTFNENSEYLVFLATTRVGGLGVNLTGANRVIIYDPDWNPATDDQAKERAWRIGQQRNVTVYRLLTAGTVEEKIYQRQIFKHILSNKILIDANQKNVLTTSNLQGLFTLEELNSNGDTETASLFNHTKVNLHKVNKNKDLSGNISLNSKKLEAMKIMAKEISTKISSGAEMASLTKQKLDKDLCISLNPSEDVLENYFDHVTNVKPEKDLSELDIVNMHVKKDYEDNLVKVVLESHEEVNEDVENYKNPYVNTEQANVGSKKQLVRQNKKRLKRKHSSETETEIKSLLSIKKIKKDKLKKNDDDDYVLSKLFAKASVRSALQHDAIVGLAEKEKKHRMKEEAKGIAREALRAIKYSTNSTT